MERWKNGIMSMNRCSMSFAIWSLFVSVGVFDSHAAVVIHDNRDGTFEWTPTVYLGDSNPIYGTFLDIRKPPSQSGEAGAGTIHKWFSYGHTGSSPGIWQMRGENGAEITQTTDWKDLYWNGSWHSSKPLREYQVEEPVSADDQWSTWAKYYYSLPHSFGMEGGLPWIADLAYFGVRIKNANNTYTYGWVLFEDWSKPLMWAYETTPNTPIQIPIPTPGALGFGLACTVWAGRRRRVRDTV
jgi:hypothetical protein